ncbi:hypothetical protein EDD27_9586 [Nonomuraea polychroma]|uniref:Uncharacterized protein n=1 Tax=Nonomuraea polychroma TaxID=46176 RepID=A0A438MLQ7_9ACTN|nr:hypothetical protein EDD27_9586 [Nonomuraea polychroma]
MPGEAKQLVAVFVRWVTMEEGRKLQRISRTAKNPVKLRRAIVVLMSVQGQTVKDITTLMPGPRGLRPRCHPRLQRAGGFDAWDPK